MSRPQRVVVTGGAGFIGVHTVEALLGDGAAILVVDDLSHPSDRRLPAAADLEVGDVGSQRARSAIVAFQPSAVLHLAAQGGVLRSWREPAVDARINVEGTVSVLQAARDAGCARVVVASSGGALYGATGALPSPETTQPAPRSPYGAAKLAAERYVDLFTRSGALQGIALRYGNVYGPGQDGTGEAGLIAITSTRLAAGAPPRVRGDGEQTRDFVHATDVARANVLALRAEVIGALNVGTGRETSVNRVVEMLAEAAGYRGDVERTAMPEGEVRRSCLDIARARSALGWVPQVRLDRGLAETYAHFTRYGS